MIFVGILILVLLVWFSLDRVKKNSIKTGDSLSDAIDQPDPRDWRLLNHVGFYLALDEKDKEIFRLEVEEFLSKVKIVGVDVEVTELDRMMIASSAVIPLFAFPDWFYPNLLTIELYRDAFNHDFETSGANRRILGMVGGGVMNGKMALSQKALQIGFSNNTDKRNTAIHEFVHLMDMADGATDGVPEILLDKHLTLPWLEYIRSEIERIREGESDIDAYGGTSETEFFTVAAEYFFERPELFRQKHPQLFELMTKAFRRVPVVTEITREKLPERNDPCWCGSGRKYKLCHGK